MANDNTKCVTLAIDLPYVFCDIYVNEGDDVEAIANEYIKEHESDIIAKFKKSADDKLFFLHHLEGDDYDPYDEFNPAL